MIRYQRKEKELKLKSAEEMRTTENLLFRQQKRIESFERTIDRALERANSVLNDFTPENSPERTKCDQGTQTPDTVKREFFHIFYIRKIPKNLHQFSK